MFFQEGGTRKKAAVFDINHGAVSLARKIRSFGIEAVAFDVYEKTNPAARNELSGKSGVPVSVSEADLDGAGVVLAPVHLSPENRFLARAREKEIPVLTHHEAAGLILRKEARLAGRCLVEISGVKGKTSTATLYAQMASFRHHVALHTSRGIEIWDNGIGRMIRPGGTISPSHIPAIVDDILERDPDPEIFIFEISLGCTGAADVSVITALDPPYDVAGRSSDSTAAKTSFLKKGPLGREGRPAGILVSDVRHKNLLDPLISAAGAKAVYFDTGIPFRPAGGADVQTAAEMTPDGEIMTIGSPAGRRLTCRPAGNYETSAYRTAFAAAAALAFVTDVPDEAIVSGIENFRGIDGRMRETAAAGRLVLDNSNSGLDDASCRAGIDAMIRKYGQRETNAKKTGRRFILVIGENAKEVCEGFSPDRAADILRDYDSRISAFILVGERMKSLSKMAGRAPGRIFFAADLNGGLMLAQEMSSENDVIISAVKCFR